VKFRQAAKVPYPNAYASDHSVALAEADDPDRAKHLHLFNCAQRAHANYLEQQPSFLVALLIAGLRFPVVSAVLGAVWCVTRVLYARGYTRADKERGKGRLVGIWFWPVQLVLIGMAMWTGGTLLRA
jgi:glutathione S-transferase